MDQPTFRRAEDGRRVYEPDGKFLAHFMWDRSPVAIIRGPIGSGTSSACCQRIWQHACEQRKGVDGVRRSKWAIIRNTFSELRTTTLQTWLFWFPEEVYGSVIREKPYRHLIRVGEVELDVWFHALDTPEDVSKLRSLEVTGVWFNELEFIPKELFDEAQSRTGRYPAVAMGGSNWSGVIADSNAPREDHWLPIVMGESAPPSDWSEEELRHYERPVGWAYFVQPAAVLEVMGADGRPSGRYEVNPEAENVKWLKGGPEFYREMVAGKSEDFIKSRLMNRITVFKDGAAVFPMFREEVHVARAPLEPVVGQPVYVGVDFGRRPAAIFAQRMNNRWAFQHELLGKDMGAAAFAPLLKQVLAQHYPGCEAFIYGDPKGQDRTQSDERTAYDIFRSFGLGVLPAPIPDNSIKTRIEAYEFALNGMVDGKPRFQVSRRCRALIVALGGGYHWKRVQGSTYINREAPVKNNHSDPVDAGGYLLLGAGEGRAMRGIDALMKPKPVVLAARNKSRRRFG